MGSDADVGIKVERPLRLLEEVALAQALASALDVPAVDLVDIDRASLRLKGRIVQEGPLLFSADEPARVAFEVRTRSEYFDFRPTLDAHRRRSSNGSPREVSVVDRQVIRGRQAPSAVQVLPVDEVAPTSGREVGTLVLRCRHRSTLSLVVITRSSQGGRLAAFEQAIAGAL